VLADLLRLMGQALLAMGRADEAYEALRRARVEAVARDSDRMSWIYLCILWQRRTCWQVLLTLSEIEAQRGKRAEAKAMAKEAQGLVKSIAHHAVAPQLSAAFLSLSDVRVVLDLEY
jgi:hypothetical protein